MHILIILLAILSIVLLIRNYYLSKYIEELEYTMLTLASRVLSEDNIDKLIK
ncbi:hypothetical protein [Staphylococcus chromogenes]|uniref:hypothetical protein n=1 Tax=Staphylococcus chromogenes TaxID=46126 RepID=UPI001300AE7D|nr:hypothetical protein [Staphylococcus chromogenes]